MNTKPCKLCGGPALVLNPSRWERTKYCSRKCQMSSRGQEYAHKMKAEARQFNANAISHGDWLELPLRAGGSVLIDTVDLKQVHHWFWLLNDGGYAKRDRVVNGKKRSERMHRLIMSIVLGRELHSHEQVDHINGDRTDNRRRNLRLANNSENQQNSRRAHPVGQYRGIHRQHSTVEKFSAKIKISGTSFYIGCFETREEAAWMYDQWALALHGEFASLNFDYEVIA